MQGGAFAAWAAFDLARIWLSLARFARSRAFSVRSCWMTVSYTS
jgi:hypothetical protein